MSPTTTNMAENGNRMPFRLFFLLTHSFANSWNIKLRTEGDYYFDSQSCKQMKEEQNVLGYKKKETTKSMCNQTADHRVLSKFIIHSDARSESHIPDVFISLSLNKNIFITKRNNNFLCKTRKAENKVLSINPGGRGKDLWRYPSCNN